MRTSPDERGVHVRALTAGYGAAMVVRDVSATFPAGTVTAVIGPNGSGKSTLLKAIAGTVEPREGAVTLDGAPLTGRPPHVRARAGLAYVPQENEVFRSLSVRENLEIGGYVLPRRAARAAVDRVLARFPGLARRQTVAAGHLSGGERRLLAIARTLLRKQTAVLLDEPSAGLSPTASEELLAATVPALAAEGAAVVLVEQRVRQALAVADEAYVMVAGTVRVHGPAATLAADPDIGAHFLGGGT